MVDAALGRGSSPRPGGAPQGRGRITNAEARSNGSVQQKLSHGLNEFVVLSLYFYTCFAVIVLYKVTVLQVEGIGYAPYGVAAAKALILSKFVFIGHAAHVDSSILDGSRTMSGVARSLAEHPAGARARHRLGGAIVGYFR